MIDCKKLADDWLKFLVLVRPSTLGIDDSIKVSLARLLSIAELAGQGSGPMERAELAEMLHEVWTYLDQRSDVSDDGDGGVMPNEAMHLMGKVEAALAKLEAK